LAHIGKIQRGLSSRCAAFCFTPLRPQFFVRPKSLGGVYFSSEKASCCFVEIFSRERKCDGRTASKQGGFYPRRDRAVASFQLIALLALKGNDFFVHVDAYECPGRVTGLA
jgi:hypothetical protein